MEIITWNIQAALGVDDQVSPKRIADTLRSFGDSDILCLQEVDRLKTSDGFTGLAGELCQFFPNHEMIFGPAIDRPAADHSATDPAGKSATDLAHQNDRYQFGNMILSRVPVDFVFMHRLPQPADPTTRTMARQAVEIFVSYKDKPLRIVTTHLEYFGIGQRQAQLQYFMQHQQECNDRNANPSPSGEGTYIAPPETDRTILCGDFNMEVDSDHYHRFIEKSRYQDAWKCIHSDRDRTPTCGIYDHVQWPHGEHCRDFFFVADGMENCLRNIEVETKTQASDHQPVKLVLV